MAEAHAPDVEAHDGEVVAYFPTGISAAFLDPADARRWAAALMAAADAADAIGAAKRNGTGTKSCPTHDCCAATHGKCA